MNKENEINDENQSYDLNKTSKIDFRLPTKMKDMVVTTAQKKGLKVSQFITNLVEKYFEEQAKRDRINLELEKQNQLKIQQDYAEFDKKLKHQKADFTVDQPDDIAITETKKNTIMETVLTYTLTGCGIYLLMRFFRDTIFGKEQEKHLPYWNTYPPQNTAITKPTMSGKKSDKFVRQMKNTFKIGE